MTDLTANLPTDCPACGREACGYPCDCGWINYPAIHIHLDGRRHSYPHNGCHQFCCTCGAHYVVPKSILLAQQALNSLDERKNEDIDAWAEQLADDVCDATD